MKAVVYDKWLSSLGGGEVVACSMARILKDVGYQVIFISGKKVSKDSIFEKFKINLEGIEFIEIWDDELALKRVVKDSDVFINISFMDYSRGFAKKNFYYAHFPTQLYLNMKGMFFTKVILPIIKKFGKNIEPITAIDAPIIVKGQPAYCLTKHNRYALSNLTISKEQKIEFTLFIENLDKKILESINITLDNGDIKEKKVKIDHHHNILLFNLKIVPRSSTAYLNLDILDKTTDDYFLEKGEIYLFYPKIYLQKMPNIYLNNLLERMNNKLRAGLFTDHLVRLSTYQSLITHSQFVRRWIKSYWRLDTKVLYPPADLLFQKYRLDKYKKRNWICSVGRFFTLGHGKKQEILIEAFKKLYKRGFTDWELHLVGGLGKEPTSIEFFKYLREISQGYPVYFHVDAPKKELEEVYLKSKIYWHATGFGENERTHPVRFEHFGITPVEALSAGCIPILYNGGGLVESIKLLNLDSQKYLYNSMEELINKTQVQMSQDKSDIDWQHLYELLDLRFSTSAFKRDFLEIINN